MTRAHAAALPYPLIPNPKNTDPWRPQVFGAPIAASLLALDGLCGLAGWQWLFVVEGLPTIALGLYIARTLAPSPAQAAFLTPEEREWLCARNARVKACRAPPCLHRVSPASTAFLSQSTQHGAGMLISLDGMRTCLLARSARASCPAHPLRCVEAGRISCHGRVFILRQSSSQCAPWRPLLQNHGSPECGGCWGVRHKLGCRRRA